MHKYADRTSVKPNRSLVQIEALLERYGYEVKQFEFKPKHNGWKLLIKCSEVTFVFSTVIKAQRTWRSTEQEIGKRHAARLLRVALLVLKARLEEIESRDEIGVTEDRVRIGLASNILDGDGTLEERIASAIGRGNDNNGRHSDRLQVNH